MTATIVALAALRLPPSLEGRELLSDIDRADDASEPPSSPDARAARVRLQDDDAFSFAWNAHLRSVTTENLHLLHDPSVPALELYDLRDDPRAQENRFERGGRAARRMRRKLEEHERHLSEVEQRSAELREHGSAPAVGDAAARQLRALGYVE